MSDENDGVARALLAAGAAGIALGSIWDVSWDASIGVHSFTSPPHVAVNLGGVLVAAAGVLLGRRRPLAAALALLGAAAMAVAEAVGLLRGVPPILADGWSALQVVAVAGMAAAVAAGVALGLERGTAGGGERAVAVGLLLALAATALGAYSLPNLQRTALFHQLSAAVYPGVLALALAAPGGRWAATAAAAVYTIAVAALVWLLPLFPASPATQPVFHPVEHMLPPRFPLLLLVPAVGFDLARRAQRQRPWLQPPLLAAVFCATFLPVQWYFAAFLLAPASAGRFFAGGGEHWPFFVQVGSERAMFWGLEQSPVDAAALGLTFLLALASAACGQALGTLAARRAGQARRLTRAASSSR